MKKLLTALLLLFSTPAVAGVSCSVPFNLTNGTTADASQVMANYNAILACLSTGTAASGANSDITSLLGLPTPLAHSEGGTAIFVGGTSTGTANAQVVATLVPNSFGLTTGNTAVFTAGFTNTAALTLNVNGTGVKNVFRQSPSGAQAMTGGEIIAGSVVQVIYDGTQYQIVDPQAQFGGFGPLTNLASATTTDLGTIPSHNVNVTGVVTITGLGSSASLTYPLYRLTFAGVLTLTYNATSLIVPGTANITTAANDTAWALYLGSGNWQIVQYTQANGQPIVGKNNVDVQVFTTPGANTWTRASGVNVVQVFMCGAGGGGGGGGRNATSTATSGGGGGGGGYCQDVTYKAADAGSSQTVTIGTGGTAGAGATANGNAGVNGGNGGNSTFGSLLTAYGGSLGIGGPASNAGAGGGNGGGPITGVSFCSGSAAQTATVNCPWGGAGGGAGSGDGGGSRVSSAGGNASAHGPGGGGGGGWSAGNAAQASAAGGGSIGCATAPSGGGANTVGGSTAADFNYHPGCGGGGGGGGAATPGAGGAGTSAGGGGGGGAGSAVTAGAGGVGGNGLALVVSW